MIDLFAGIGGIRRGFELTGAFRNVLSAEIDKNACKMYKHLFGDDPFNDVTSEKFKTKVETTDYDILLGGFPCQAFSIAGSKQGFRDKTRGTLFFDIADIIHRTRPKAFLLENVQGLISHQKGETFRVILETLVNDLKYKVVGVESKDGKLIYDPKKFVANSKNFGLPQNRPRVYFMGFDTQYYKNTDVLTIKEIPKKAANKPIYENLHELLELKAKPEYYLSSGYLETLKKHKARHKSRGNGFGYMVVNEKGINNPTSNAVLATGGSGKERNLVYDPQTGIAGKMEGAKHTPLNREGIRAMTPREWGKLQGFINYGFMKTGEDTFSFPEGLAKGQLYKQFGNAVTIPVIQTMAEAMLECLEVLE